jgi:cell wall-associated NlpC family hydrolase
MQPGDILLFKIDGNPQHMAIKTDKGMIHAYARGPRKVEEVSFAPPWPERLVGVWRVPFSAPPTVGSPQSENTDGGGDVAPIRSNNLVR